YRFLQTGSWALVSRSEFKFDRRSGEASMRIAFHPIGHIAAVLDADFSGIRLVDVPTGSQLAPLDGTDGAQTHCLAFSPDGRFLTVSRNDQTVEIWDLARIRSRLEELGLAAGIPDAFGSETTAVVVPAIERIQVHGAGPAGLRLLAARQAVRELGVAIRERFDSPLTHPDALSVRAISP